MAKQIKVNVSYDEFATERIAQINSEAEAKGKELKPGVAERRTARAYLKEVVAIEANAEPLEAVLEALKILFPTRVRKERTGSRGTPKAKIREAIKGMILGEGTISEQEVFMSSMELGSAWGRSEMKDFIKASIKTAPEDRIWVELLNQPGEPMGTYVLKGTGPDAPEGWEGYVPVDTEVDL